MNESQNKQNMWRGLCDAFVRSRVSKKEIFWAWLDYRSNIFEAMDSGGASEAREMLREAIADGWNPRNMAGWRSRDLRAQGFGDLPLSTIGDCLFRSGSQEEQGVLLDLAAAVIEAGADVNHSCSPEEVMRWRARGVVSSKISEANAIFNLLGYQHLFESRPKSKKEIPLKAMSRLLALGADPNVEINGITPLWICAAGASKFDYEKIFAALLDAGALATPVPASVARLFGCEGGQPMAMALAKNPSCFAMSSILEAKSIGAVAGPATGAIKKVLRI